LKHQASPDAKAQWLSFPLFYDHLGLELQSIGEGKCVVGLPYAKHFGNARGEVHGGIVASLLDITMSQALRSKIDGVADVATISMTVSYLAPALGVLTCTSTTIRGGRSIGFVEGEVNDAKGHAVCRAVGTYRILRKH
jgi:uncharacterized protein (TIGR00369 family)